MIPAMFIEKHRSEFIQMGFTVGSDFTYKDLRGRQKGTGPEQTLITWNTSEKDTDMDMSALEKITSTLPYIAEDAQQKSTITFSPPLTLTYGQSAERYALP